MEARGRDYLKNTDKKDQNLHSYLRTNNPGWHGDAGKDPPKQRELKRPGIRDGNKRKGVN